MNIETHNKVMNIAKNIGIIIFQICSFGIVILLYLYPKLSGMYLFCIPLAALPYVFRYSIANFIFKLLNIKKENEKS